MASRTMDGKHNGGLERPADRSAYTALTEQWARQFGCSHPKNLSRRLLAHAIAHEEQVHDHGGLNAKTRRLLRASATSAASLAQNTSLTPGTRLIREWNGKTYVLNVTDTGFKIDKREFRSLSAAAKAITGSHWNGRAFFGLVKRKGPTSSAEIEQ